jgi:hypothetical protein
MTTGLPPSDSSVIGRLLQELSWSGRSIRRYRDGGLGDENVLTAEVLQGLDLLPRRHFFGPVVAAAHGAPAARARLVQEAEEARLTVLPREVAFGLGEDPEESLLSVYPDGLIESPGCSVMIEAKRLRRGSFQPEQLAREFFLTWTLARGKTPLLLLFLPGAPPVAVRGRGRMEIEEAIAEHLALIPLGDSLQGEEVDLLLEKVPDVVAWITWQEVSAVVQAQLESLTDVEPSLRASIERLAATVTEAVERHA